MIEEGVSKIVLKAIIQGKQGNLLPKEPLETVPKRCFIRISESDIKQLLIDSGVYLDVTNVPSTAEQMISYFLKNGISVIYKTAGDDAITQNHFQELAEKYQVQETIIVDGTKIS